MCNLSSLLLNISISELAEQIQRLNRGMVVGDNNIDVRSLVYKAEYFV